MSTFQPLRLLVITSRPLVIVEPARQNGQLTVARRPIALQPVWHVRRELERALQAADGPVAVRYLARATTAAVQAALLDPYDVVHFVGHGTEDGSLLLEQDNAMADALAAERAAQMLRGSQARLVVISACHSGKVAPALRQAGIANVVAVDAQWPIADRAAALFNQLFYGSLVRGRTLSDAFRQGVDAVRVDNEVGDHRRPEDEQTGAELPPWSARFLSFYSADRPLLAGGTQGEYTELRQWSVPTNLPHTPDIIGREALMADIITALGTARLVTLSGPGGIGKTTVGIEVARWHADRELFRHGVLFVPLEGISDATRLAEALASTLAVTPDPQQPWETVRAALANRDILLLLDNAEGLLEAPETDHASAVGALGRLLEAAPGLKLLVTSREALGLRRWEQQVEVAEMDRSEAQRLLLRYAPAAQRVALALMHRAEVRAICSTLDYYPLALVIAAPQLDEAGMTPERLRHDLREEMLAVLEDMHSRGVPERLRSLRASLNLSYQRLSGRARIVFFSLGALPGGASEEVLTALTGTRFEPAARELVARNLAHWEDSRYTLLAPLRAYAVETRLQKRLTAARLRAARFYARLASTMDDWLRPLARRERADRLVEQGAEQSRTEIERGLTLVALRTLDAERTNLLAAVEWAFTGQAWTLVRTLVDHFNTYLHLRALWGDMVTLGQMATRAAQQEGNRAAVGGALNNLGVVYEAQGELDKALSTHQDSLDILLEVGDFPNTLVASCSIGWLHHRQGDLDTALEHFARALVLALALHPHPVIETLDQIIALAKEVTASGNGPGIVQLGQKMQEVVEQRNSQGWQDDALQAVGMLCHRVCAVLMLLGALATVPPKPQREVRLEILEGAKEIDTMTEGRWGLAAWVTGLLYQRAGILTRGWRWLTTAVLRR